MFILIGPRYSSCEGPPIIRWPLDRPHDLADSRKAVEMAHAGAKDEAYLLCKHASNNTLTTDLFR